MVVFYASHNSRAVSYSFILYRLDKYSGCYTNILSKNGFSYWCKLDITVLIPQTDFKKVLTAGMLEER